MIRDLYRNRIKSLVREYGKFKKYSEDVKIQLADLEHLALSYNKEIEEITLSDIKSDLKYELINPKLEEIEKIATKLNNIHNSINEKFKTLTKEKDILIKTCLESSPELTENDIIKEIIKITEEGS